RDRQERERAAQLERERDLRERLAAEERAAALRAGPEALAWASVIAAHIQRQWFRPPSAQPGLRCVIIVDQIPGGVVTSARIADCNGDAVVRQSIEAAVMRASPLPPPPDPALFERRLEIVFAPVD
ncbi:MAG: TonB C-terminal domain-containing protein, partial [Steroidobacteraceae bacterium]|nr:TonB C-terminal domain-containing protein [Steroidobacteraceae bacterium]MDW8259324.1 TonB C-terminal domain-containing protein [Gammaproteobacteria bacterium]